ncbi:unnamed protein product [Ilex paraguariensis]|uniref:t-SNARE coiled-coil homology domain-containing protein n=1 Tax=Ilex paraguariensis TaxID=185542 RepID=A0ABC8R5I1_9AQUA
MFGKGSFEIPQGRASRNGDIEMGRHPPMNSGELGLDNFFKQFLSCPRRKNDCCYWLHTCFHDSFKVVQEIEKQYDKLNKLLRKLQDAHEESKAVTKAATMKAIKQRMEKDVEEVGKVARLVKSKIEEIDRDNLANRQKPGCGKGTGVDRSRTATTVALKKKFKDKMSEFQNLRENIHQEYREVVERRVFTVTGNRADEETIDRLIETGDSEQIFQKAIWEQGRGQIMDTLSEIQERHDAVREVERKLLELQQERNGKSLAVVKHSDKKKLSASTLHGNLVVSVTVSMARHKALTLSVFSESPHASWHSTRIFLDMAVLVDAQGDMLDNIESQVSSAVDHVRSGNTALQKAKSSQKNSRKWMCIAILILLIIVIVIVVGVLKPWNSNKGA